MLVTVTREEKVTSQVEVNFPCYFKSGCSFICFTSHHESISVFSLGDMITISTCNGGLGDILSTHTEITSQEFGAALIKVTEVVARRLPAVDGLKLNIHPAKLTA